MSKTLLHVTKLDAFMAYLDKEAIPHRPGRGSYQVLQVCKDGLHWNCVYRRDVMPEHFTTDRHLDNLVIRFARSAKGRVAKDTQKGPDPVASVNTALEVGDEVDG